MPELEPLNVVEASASMPIPLATQNEQKQAVRKPSDIWKEKVKEFKEQNKQDLLYFQKHWNPLNLQLQEKAQHDQTEDHKGCCLPPACCDCCSTSSSYRRTTFWYTQWADILHLSRDTSKLLCLLAIVGLPWNQPTKISEDQMFASIVYVYLVMFTLMASGWTMPDTGSGNTITFFRTVLLIEKTRESIATKRKAFVAHTIMIICFVFYYMCLYIQSSCYEKHYGPNRNQWNFKQIEKDRKWNGIEPCRYWSPFPIEPVTLNRSSYRESGEIVPLTFWWPVMPDDALLPNSISFYLVVFAYFAKVFFDVFLYNDVYNHGMLPSPEFVRTHYPAMFAKAKEIIIRERSNPCYKCLDGCGRECGRGPCGSVCNCHGNCLHESLEELRRIAEDAIEKELKKSIPADQHHPFPPHFFEPYIPIKPHRWYWFMYDSSTILRNIIIVCDRVSAYVQKHEPKISKEVIVSEWRKNARHKAIRDSSLEWGHIEHMCIGDVIKVHEYLHVGLALSNTVISNTVDGEVAHV